MYTKINKKQSITTVGKEKGGGFHFTSSDAFSIETNFYLAQFIFLE